MSYIEKNNPRMNASRFGFMGKLWFKIAAAIVVVLVVIGGAFAWKTDSVLKKISDGGLLESLSRSIPGVNNDVKGEAEGRINILLLGMRGVDLPGGGNLADTIMLASILPKENKVAMISIPRDLYVTVPGTGDKQKINAVHAYGEQKGEGQGMEDMKTAVSEVTGLPIHYAVRTNFAGFKQLIDAVGGIEVTLSQPFDESMQFNQEHVCDSFFNIPTGNFENKTVKYFSKTTQAYKTRVVASYPLCNAPQDTLECGGNFKLPAGKQTLNGEQALCFARSRYATSDFERAKRQQEIIQLVKDRLMSAGTLTDFGKVNDILDSLGDNVRTDMKSWEIKRMYEIYGGMANPQIYRRVLENSEEGLLYNPPQGDAGYILLPIGDNYDKIRDMAKNIFTMPAQTDIKPKI
ncbi:MAG: LCP family protein [Candidatus Moranbacteria bacterium]|nr:LCP family protein [Candidatus Moranbacteria bacterium]